MSGSLRPWLPRQHRIPGLILALGYGWLLVTALSGLDDWVLATHIAFWPVWLGLGLAFDPGGLGRNGNRRPDYPSGRVALAGVAFAMSPASIWIAYGSMVSLSGPAPRLDTDWLILLMVAMGALSGLAILPDPANWVRQWNNEQAARLVAAEHALATARAQVLQSQMQPHFLFNALNSVTALLREDPARARAVLLSLKGLMERSLANSQEPMTSVRAEVAFVRDQLAIEQERFHDRLQVSFDVPDSLLHERIPAFSLQPLAENALRHGIARSIDGGRVSVRVSREATDLVLRVENTGAGLEPRWREGTGLSNLRARLSSLYNDRASLMLEQAGTVTVSEVRIPLSGPRTFQPGPLVQAPGGFD